MKHWMRFVVVALVCMLAQKSWAGLVIGNVPETVTLQDKLGGRLDGTPWSSAEFKGKVTVLFYVDPDEKDLNNDASEALKKENFPLHKYQSYAIINMAATWLPNFAISSALKKKQKIYARTIYVRDYKKVLVDKWGLADNNSDVLAFDKAGNLIFRKDGKLNAIQIAALIKAIRDHLTD
jgi:predicted transcriptional regulator